MLDANPNSARARETADGTLRIKRRALFGADQGGDRARFSTSTSSHTAREAPAPPSGHRPVSGRDTDRASPSPAPLWLPTSSRSGACRGPTLGLIVEREMTARPTSRNRSGGVRQVQAPRRHLRGAHWSTNLGESRVRRGARGSFEPGTVKSVTARKNTRKPPTPTTPPPQHRRLEPLGITPESAMRIAETSTWTGSSPIPHRQHGVPSSLPLRELVTSLVRIKEVLGRSGLARTAPLTRTRGKKRRPTIRRSTRPSGSPRRLGGTEERSTNWSCAASSPPSVHR